MAKGKRRATKGRPQQPPRKRGGKKGGSSSYRTMEGFSDPFDDISVTSREDDIKMRRRDMQPIQAPKNWKKGVMQALAITGLAAVVISPIVSVSAALVANSSASVSKERADDLYNPSLRARYGDLGKSVIQAWFEGAQQIVPTADNVAWPNNPPVDGVGLAPNKETRDYVEAALNEAGTADISNIFLIDASGDSLSVADSISSDDANDLSRSYQETLFYSAMLNNMPVTISVVFFVPDVHDTTRMPILAAAPIIGAPSPLGSTMPGLVIDPGPTQERPGYELQEDDLSIVNEWAKAYVSGDQRQLKIITGDTNNDAYYVGLNGWKLESQSVTPKWAYIRESDQYVVAEVGFTISQVNTIQDRVQQSKEDAAARRQSGTPNPKGDKFTTQQSMDVLISGAGSGNPRVVAWGMPGTWNTLEPYENAYTLQELEDLGVDLEQRREVNESLRQEDRDAVTETSTAPAPAVASGQSNTGTGN